MPHTNTWELTGLYRKFIGEVDGEEILESNFEVQAHPNFKCIKYIINDFIEMAEFAITTDHTRIYAKTDDIIANSKGRLKIAIIATHDEHIALANHYREEMKNNKFDCEIFDTEEDARKWTNLPQIPF